MLNKRATKKITNTLTFSVRTLLEGMGKTLFFRSGEEPLVLTEEQREVRKQGIYDVMMIK